MTEEREKTTVISRESIICRRKKSVEDLFPNMSIILYSVHIIRAQEFLGYKKFVIILTPRIYFILF